MINLFPFTISGLISCINTFLFFAALIGQTLLKEAPYGAVIDETNLTKYCSSCFKSSSQPLSRCSLCKQLYYCSRQCQTNDWKQYHSIECPAFTKIGKPVPTAIRCLTRILISRANAPASYNRVEILASRKYAQKKKDLDIAIGPTIKCQI